ncbi:MAG: hypothetical protein Q7T80_11805 [Methanoregula sp.]|nr:hypothetical protein [Methanoregula sp.]
MSDPVPWLYHDKELRDDYYFGQISGIISCIFRNADLSGTGTGTGPGVYRSVWKSEQNWKAGRPSLPALILLRECFTTYLPHRTDFSQTGSHARFHQRTGGDCTLTIFLKNGI